MERGLRAIAMVFIILVVIWAFWKNNENMIKKLQQTQSYWDETQQGKPYIKSFTHDFAISMEKDYGITAQVLVLKDGLPELDLDEGQLTLALWPAGKKATIAMNPMTDEDQKLVRTIEDGYFDDYWTSGWEPGLESALVLIWEHYSGDSAGFFDAVAASDTAPPASVVDETNELSEDDLAFVHRFVTAMNTEFGQEAVVRIFEGEVFMPEAINRTLFIGLSPSRQDVVVAFPPLVKKALPAGFEGRLMSEHFPPYMASGDWKTGLKAALIKTWKGLAGTDMQDGMLPEDTQPTE